MKIKKDIYGKSPVKFILAILLVLFITSCQDNSGSNDLKDRISNLEIRVDSLQNQIQKLSEPKSLPLTKKKTTAKKKETNNGQFLINEPEKQPIEKITVEQKQEVPVKTTTYSDSYSGESHQCLGTTKKGTRCKRMVRGGNYCWQHGG